MRNKVKLMTRGHHGAAILVFTLVLVTLSTLIILFAANYGRLNDKSVTNINRHYQAFEAAQAGMEFGINYLDENNAAILASPAGGYILPYSNSSTNNVVLANNSRYTITYSNPVANNYTLIKVTSVGTSDDGTSTHTVSQLVQFGSVVMHPPTVPVTSKGDITLGGNSEIINTFSNNTIQSGGDVQLNGSSSTITSSGVSSTSGYTGSDIQESISSISDMSTNDYFSSYFGLPPSNVKNSVQHYYSNSGSTNYSGTLSGMAGTSIWIDQTGGTASFNGSVTIGSIENPVLLVIDGNVQFAGNLTVYGYVFILGSSTTDLLGNVSIIGGMTTTGNINATGSIQVSYSPTVLSNMQNNSSMRYYAKVPGSWKDF